MLKKLGLAALILFLFLGSVIYFGSRDQPTFNDYGLLASIRPMPSPADNGYFELAHLETQEFEVSDDYCQSCRLNQHIHFETWNPEFVRQTLAENQDTIQRTQEASSYTAFSYPNTGGLMELPNFSPVMTAVKLLLLESMAAARAGKVDFSVARADDALELSILVKSGATFPILCQIIGAHMQQQVVNWLHRLANDFALTSRELKSIQLLLEKLPQYSDDYFANVFGNELEYQQQIYDQMFFLPFFPRWRNYWDSLKKRDELFEDYSPSYSGQAANEFLVMLFPRYYLHRNRTLEQSAEHYANLARQADLHCADMPASKLHTTNFAFWNYLKPNSAFDVWEGDADRFDKYFIRRCYSHAHTQAVKTIIALKRFRADHGALPESLEQLTPDYMRELPKDAFSGNSLLYSKADGWVFSVGANGKNDGGSLKADTVESCEQTAECINNPTFPIQPPVLEDTIDKPGCGEC